MFFRFGHARPERPPHYLGDDQHRVVRNGYDPFGLFNLGLAGVADAVKEEADNTGVGLLKAGGCIPTMGIPCLAYDVVRPAFNEFQKGEGVLDGANKTFDFLNPFMRPTKEVKKGLQAAADGKTRDAAYSATKVTISVVKFVVLAKAVGGVKQVPMNPKIRHHITNIDGFTQKKGVLGAHTTTSFTKAIHKFNLKIMGIKKHPTKNGIFQVEYRVPAKTSAGTVLPGKFKGNGKANFKKTLYDPKVISTDKVMSQGRKAVEKAGVTSGSVSASGFRIFFKDGMVDNFFPNF